MNKIIILLAIIGCWAGHVLAQETTSTQPLVHHALFIHAGGAAFGVGPGYELQLSKPGGFTLGLAFGLPLGHETRHRYYSPISLSPAINLIYGRRAWKMELSTEYNYFLEWGRSMRGARVPYHVHTLAWMGGVRRQLPWVPLIFRANFGVSVVNMQKNAEILPAATLSLGYLIGSRQVAETALPPKPIFQFGHHLGPAYSGGRKTLQLQLAPTASFSVERPWQSVDHWAPANLYLVKYDYQFQTQWASQVGVMADLGNAGAIAGLRVGLAAGLRSVRMDWTSRSYGVFPNGNILLEDNETHIDEMQLTWELNASLRLRTLQPQPWVVQIGAFTGDFCTLRSGSWYYSDSYPYGSISPNSPRYGVGPMVSVSKQFAIGTHAIEPFLSGKCNYHNFFPGPQLNQWSTSAGAMLWL